jgi:two-component system, OmpR family, copper resistance phosphate regulon response regulator CusR
MRILVVEDEKGIANFIRDGLTEEGFAVDVAHNGTAGLEMALANDYDVILLDWMLPGMSGIEVCRHVRAENHTVPIIFLTARDTTPDVVFALETGANDYIKKPLQFDELLARVHVQLRTASGGDTVLRLGSLTLDPESHQVVRDGNEITLTAKEFALLEFLIRNKGKVCSRTRIIEHVWDIHFDADTSVIDVYVNYLRKKLDAGSEKSCIQTVRGVGYVVREVP